MYLMNIISSIGEHYLSWRHVYNVIGSVLAILMAYKTVYWLIGLFFTRKFKPAKKKHKYAILIAARNEKNVIGNLLDSINKQDYPSELLTTFVVADNCTDNTAEIARKHGAVCYERFDNEHKTKGFALQYLLEKIEEDYDRMSFEGYFIFDADNLLKNDYISKMNDAFDSGEKIITSYRNTKNFDENWIASTYAIHWIRSIRCNHRARSVLRLATNIQGTGFLFTNEIVKNGWHYTSLTEDRALTADAVAQGYRISYQDEAMFYDEQPTSLKVALRQRTRWSKGHLLAFIESGPYLFINIFFGKLFLKTRWQEKKKKKEKKTFKSVMLSIVESIRHRFASFDTLMQLTPFSVFNLARWLIVVVIMYGCYCYNMGINGSNLFSGSTYLAKALRSLFEIKIVVNPGINAFFVGMLISIWFRLLYRIGMYFQDMWIAVYVFIIERKNIKKISFMKKVLYTLTWPTFDIIGRYSTYAALFMKVTWKPIPHDSKVTIDDIHNNKEKNSNTNSNIRWLVTVFITTFILSIAFSFISTNSITNLPLFPAILILFLVIFIGIFFDIIGVAVTVADENEFHAKASKRIAGSKTSVKLIRNSAKVANFCADVIGDICGVLSGSISASIALKITASFGISFNIQFLISALVASLTVSGKAIGKTIAQKNSTKIVHAVAVVLNKLHLNQK